MNRARLAAAAIAVAVLLGAGGFLIGRFTSPSVPVPADTSAAAGFLRDMQVHHAQAVDMAMTIRDISDDPALRTLAYDIALGQSNQSGQMYGLLESWGLSQTSPQPAMAWMSQPVLDGSDGGDHGHSPSYDGSMPGLATSAQLAELRAATGVEAEKLFLTLMIAHHQGGLEMAEGVLARTTVPQVIAMAKGIIVSQQADIGAMEQMLADRG